MVVVIAVVELAVLLRASPPVATSPAVFAPAAPMATTATAPTTHGHFFDFFFPD